MNCFATSLTVVQTCRTVGVEGHVQAFTAAHDACLIVLLHFHDINKHHCRYHPLIQHIIFVSQNINTQTIFWRQSFDNHIVKLTAFPGCRSTTWVVSTRPSLPDAVTVYVPGMALTNTDVCYKHNTSTIHTKLAIYTYAVWIENLMEQKLT